MQTWGWAALSGLFQALYVIFLFSAYDRADLSLIYSLSRGVAQLITVGAAGFFVGDHLTSQQFMAVAVIVSGVIVVRYSSRSTSGSNGRVAGLLLALGTGWMIAGYHLVDRRAIFGGVAGLVYTATAGGH